MSSPPPGSLDLSCLTASLSRDNKQFWSLGVHSQGWVDGPTLHRNLEQMEGE